MCRSLEQYSFVVIRLVQMEEQVQPGNNPEIFLKPVSGKASMIRQTETEDPLHTTFLISGSAIIPSGTTSHVTRSRVMTATGSTVPDTRVADGMQGCQWYERILRVQGTKKKVYGFKRFVDSEI